MRRAGDLDQDPVGTTASVRGWRKVTLLALFALVGFGCASAELQPDPLAAADSIVSAWAADGRIPGAVLMVVRDGEPVLRSAHGFAQLFDFGAGQYDEPAGIVGLEAPVPMEPGTVFDLASVTKVMATTFALMLLTDRGEVDLDQPLRTYLPDFTGEGRERVTVRHLLTHTSGLAPWVPTYYHADDEDEAYAYVRTVPLVGPPGDERRYSDLGFMVLGHLVKAVTGQRVDVFLQEELYGPLGLEETGFRPGADATSAGADGSIAATSHGNPYERRMVRDPDFGYRIEGDPAAWDGWRRRTLIGEVNDGNAYHAFGGVAGHAGLFSNAADVATLLQLLLDGGRHAVGQIVGEETVERFLTAEVPGQALGWQLPDWAPGGSFGHTGFTGTFVLGVPSERTAVVLLTNRQNVGVDEDTRYPDVGPLQRAVTSALFGPDDSTQGEER